MKIAMDDAWREKLNNGRMEGKYCDFKVIVGGQTFPVHRIILDTFSNYFRGMFANKMRESEQGFCEIPGYFAETGKVCVDYLYTGKLELNKAIAVEVLQLCHLWEVDTAISICETFLIDNLEVHTCIHSKKIASLYGLDKLADGCNVFMYEYVDEMTKEFGIGELTLEDVRGLFQYTSTQSSQAVNLWNFVVRWGECQNHGDIFCDCLESFPFTSFRLSKFLSLVWESDHVKSCQNCKRCSAKHVLDADHSREVDGQNCFYLLRISKEFHLVELGNVVEEFIVSNHRDAFEHPDFLEVGEEDMLKYILRIDNECSPRDFNRLMKWIQLKAERFEGFSKIYEDGIDESNRFLTSLRKIWRQEGTIPHAIPRKRFKVELLKWCIPTKTLCQRYSCVKLEKDLDLFILGNLSCFAEMDEVSSLTSSDIRKYSSNPLAYDGGHEHIWKVLLRWVNHDVSNRRRDFSEIFGALLLDKFPINFLREKVCKYEHVQNSLSCMNRLMETVFMRFESIEKRLDELETKVRI